MGLRPICEDAYQDYDTRLNCMCGGHMAKVGVFANVKSKTLVTYFCFRCGGQDVRIEQTKRI